MSGEQWGEAVDAAALAMYGTPRLAERNRDMAERAVRAAAELIVADTRRKVAEEGAAALRDLLQEHLLRNGKCYPSRCGDPDDHVWSEHIAELWAAAIARGSGNGDSSGQEPEACANGTERHAAALTGQPEPSGHNEDRNAHGGPQ